MRRSHNTERGVVKPFVENRPLGLALERRLDIRYKAGDLGEESHSGNAQGVHSNTGNPRRASDHPS